MEKNGKTVFLADDDASVRQTLADFFAQTDYHVVGQGCNGIETVEACRDLRPHLVLMDIQMPLLDGIQATRILVGEGLVHCVVMLTFFDEPEYLQKAIDAGASGYLTKPFEVDKILPTLDLCLEQSRKRYDLGKSYASLNRRLEQRELVDRAKLCLMEERGLSEQEAYSAIRDLSRRRKLSMAQVSEYVLQRYGR